MAITASLKKMSTKTVDFITENDALLAKVKKLKTANQLLQETEREITRKNQANQRVIKMLVEKIKESDKMISVCHESNINSQSHTEFNYHDHEQIMANNEQIKGLIEIVSEYNSTAEQSLDIFKKLLLERKTSDEGLVHNSQIREIMKRFSGLRKTSMGSTSHVSSNSARSSISEVHGRLSIMEDRSEIIQEEEEEIETIKEEKPVSKPQSTIEEKPKSQEATILPALPVQVIQRKQPAVKFRQAPKISALLQHIPQTKRLLDIPIDEPDYSSTRTISTQTSPLKFSAAVHSHQLLGELRPWGKPVKTLKKNSQVVYLGDQDHNSGYYAPELVDEEMYGATANTDSTESFF